jgi:DNA-binding response OmpR family regulator
MADEAREVLVVEDDPLIVSFMRTALRKAGHHVHSAGSGQAARELISDGGIDLLLLDLGLPDIDGLDLLRELRASGSEIPVVVVTSRSDPADRATAIGLGVEDYLVKPFPLRGLLAVVETSLGESAGVTDRLR